MVKANVDMILESLKKKKTSTVSDLSHLLRLPKEDIQKSVEYLEEDGVVKIENRFPNTFVTLVKDVESPEMKPTKIEAAVNPQINHMPLPPAPAPISAQPQKAQDSSPPPPLVVPKYQDNPTIDKGSFNLNPPINPPLTTTQQQSVDKLTVQRNDVNVQFKESGFVDPSREINKSNSPNSLPFSQNQGAFQDNYPHVPMQREPRYSDENPLEASKPSFDLNAPDPISSKKSYSSSFQDQGSSQENTGMDAPSESFSAKSDFNIFTYPEHVRTGMDRIEYLMDMLNARIKHHEYKDMTGIYRKLFDVYNDSDDLSPNERYLMGERINELFLRLKRLYVIEGITA